MDRTRVSIAVSKRKKKKTKYPAPTPNPVHIQKMYGGCLYVLEIKLIFLDRLHRA